MKIIKKTIIVIFLVFLTLIIIHCLRFFYNFNRIKNNINESICNSSDSVSYNYDYVKEELLIVFHINSRGFDFVDQAMIYKNIAISSIKKEDYFSNRKFTILFDDNVMEKGKDYVKMIITNYNDNNKYILPNNSYYLDVYYDIEKYDFDIMNDISILRIQEPYNMTYSDYSFLESFPNLSRFIILCKTKSNDETDDVAIKEHLAVAIKEHLPEQCELEIHVI